MTRRRDPWDELLEMAKATTDASKGIYGAGFAAGASASDFNNMSQSILWSYGGSVMKDGKLNLDSEESKAALKQLIKFFEEGTVAPDMISGDDMANNTAMLAGTACFVVNIPTLASALQSDAPEIWENVGACPLPAGPEGLVPTRSVKQHEHPRLRRRSELLGFQGARLRDRQEPPRFRA